MANEEQNNAAAPWDYAPLCKKDIRLFILVMIAYVLLLIAVYFCAPANWNMVTRDKEVNTVIMPEQIEADYAGKLFLQGRIKSIDETELERMSPAIREAVNEKL